MIYFVDFENTGLIGLVGAENLSAKDTIVLFASDHTPEKGVLKKLASTKASISIKYVNTTAKNAMDFCLVSYLGAEIANGRRRLCIVSQDKGYDATVSFWKERGVPVSVSPDLSGALTTSDIEEKAEKTNIPVAKAQGGAEMSLRQFIRSELKTPLTKKEVKRLAKVLCNGTSKDVCRTMQELHLSKSDMKKLKSFAAELGISYDTKSIKKQSK